MISLLVDLFTWQSSDEALLIYLLLVHYYVFVSGFLFLLYVFSLNVFLVIDFVLLPTCILGFEAPDFAYGGEDVSRRIMGSLPELAIGRHHYPERHSSPVVGGCQPSLPSLVGLWDGVLGFLWWVGSCQACVAVFSSIHVGAGVEE